MKKTDKIGKVGRTEKKGRGRGKGTTRRIEKQIERNRLYGAGPGGTLGCGQVYCVRKDDVTGTRQFGYQPMLIVSADWHNRLSRTVEAVPLTTKKKYSNLPTHVAINSLKEPSTAQCEQIQNISKGAMSWYVGELSMEEMRRVAQALSISIGLIGQDFIDSQNAPEGSGMPVKRGDIYSLKGLKKYKDMAAVVISNNVGNHFANIVEIIPLEVGELEAESTYAQVMVSDIPFTALCGEIQTVDKTRLTALIGSMGTSGIAKINHAAAYGLGLLTGSGGCAEAGVLL